MMPLGRNRWTLYLRADGLVHRVMAMYRSFYTKYEDSVYPYQGITECGSRITLIPRTSGNCQEGYYVDDAHMLSCIQCLSGVAKTGIVARQMQKSAVFSQLYGRRGYNHPPTVYGYTFSQTLIDEVKSLNGYTEVEAILHTWMEKAPKP